MRMLIKRCASTASKPEFFVVSGGLGSLLRINLQSSKIYARPNSIVGLSGQVKASLKVESVLASALRKLAGGPFFVHQLEADDAASVLLGPKRIGEIATLSLDGETMYRLKRGSFLAASDGVRFRSTVGQGLGWAIDGKLFNLEVYGRGTFAISSSYGTLHRLQLKEGEEYYVDPRHLVAWASNTKPVPLAYDSLIISELPRDASFAEMVQFWLFGIAKKLTVGNWKSFKSWFYGDAKSLYRASGPGDFYLCSRTEPSLKLIDTYAGVAEEASRLREAMKSIEYKKEQLLPKEDPPIVRPNAIVTIERSQNEKPRVTFEYTEKKGEEPSLKEETKETIQETKAQTKGWKRLLFGSK